MNTVAQIRAPAVAGMFYPKDAQQLRQQVDELLLQGEVPTRSGEVVALIVPHAGYMYSGLTAAKAFAAVRNSQFDVCVLVGPSHYEVVDGISLYSGDAFATPLGELSVNKALRKEALQSSSIIFESTLGHRSREHALEVELPFLQVLNKQCAILPITIGDQCRANAYEFGAALARICKNKNVLLIASSDLSHFHTSDAARMKDHVIIEHVRAMDDAQLMDALETGRGEACGGGAIVAVLSAAKELGINECAITHSCNSGDVTGDMESVVGYFSAVLWKKN